MIQEFHLEESKDHMSLIKKERWRPYGLMHDKVFSSGISVFSKDFCLSNCFGLYKMYSYKVFFHCLFGFFFSPWMGLIKSIISVLIVRLD